MASDRLWFQGAVEGLFVRDLKSVLERSEGRARVSFTPVEGLTAGQSTQVSLLSDDGAEALMQFEWKL